MTLIKKIYDDHLCDPDTVMQYSKIKVDGKSKGFKKITKKEFFNEVKSLTLALLDLDLKKDDLVALISDNRREWLLVDFALMSIGALNIPRGLDSSLLELKYILSYCNSRVIFVENKSQKDLILSIKDKLKDLEIIIIMDEFLLKPEENEGDIKVFLLFDLIKKYEKQANSYTQKYQELISLHKEDDIITIIFTSGTTGLPKGVMISHKNFIFQCIESSSKLLFIKDSIFLSVLPVWHSFERVVEYIALYNDVAIAYSKPIGSVMLKDMKELNPMFLILVPRIIELIYEKILRKIKKENNFNKTIFYFFQNIVTIYSKAEMIIKDEKAIFSKKDKVNKIKYYFLYLFFMPLNFIALNFVFKNIKSLFGKKFKYIISAGAALPSHVANFFRALKTTVIEGYGLTETSPVVSVMSFFKPVADTVGTPLNNTELKILDENGLKLNQGQLGILWVKGPQVMKGYYKDEENTNKVLKDGWLNTGDLAMLTVNNEIKILGRAKDTIVLSGGENIAPLPIEKKVSSLLEVDNCILVGQDKKFLSILILPNMEFIEEFISKLQIKLEDFYNNKEIIEFYRKKIDKLINKKNGFKTFEKITKIKLINDTFEIGKELSAKLDIKRYIIYEKYKDIIENLYNLGEKNV